MLCFTCSINRSYFPAICRKNVPIKGQKQFEGKAKSQKSIWGNSAHMAPTVSFRILLPQPKIHTSFLPTFQANGVTCNTVFNLIIFTLFFLMIVTSVHNDIKTLCLFLNNNGILETSSPGAFSFE